MPSIAYTPDSELTLLRFGWMHTLTGCARNLNQVSTVLVSFVVPGRTCCHEPVRARGNPGSSWSTRDFSIARRGADGHAGIRGRLWPDRGTNAAHAYTRRRPNAGQCVRPGLWWPDVRPQTSRFAVRVGGGQAGS